MVGHAFNPRQTDLCEFKARWVYIVMNHTALGGRELLQKWLSGLLTTDEGSKNSASR